MEGAISFFYFMTLIYTRRVFYTYTIDHIKKPFLLILL